MRHRIRVLAAATVLAALPCTAFAQKAPDSGASGQFEPGSKILSADLLVGGLGSYGYGESVGSGVGVGVAFEVGVAKFADRVTLGIGGSVGYVHTSFNYGVYGYSYAINQIPIFAMANGHYQFAQLPKLDVYGGVSLGVSAVSYGNGYGSSTTDPLVGVQVGGRWALSDHMSVMAQLGGGSHVPLLTAGVTLKF